MQTAPNTDPTAVTFSNGGTSFTGDAVHLFRAMTLKQGISLYMKCGMIPTRGMTISKMLKIATQITGKTYKNSEAGRQQAHDDLVQWIEACKAATPVIDNRT